MRLCVGDQQQIVIIGRSSAAPTSDNAHDEWMRDGRLDVQRLLVQLLQLLVVLLRRVHLDLQRVDLQQLGPLLHVVFTRIRLRSDRSASQRGPDTGGFGLIYHK